MKTDFPIQALFNKLTSPRLLYLFIKIEKFVNEMKKGLGKIE